MSRYKFVPNSTGVKAFGAADQEVTGFKPKAILRRAFGDRIFVQHILVRDCTATCKKIGCSCDVRGALNPKEPDRAARQNVVVGTMTCQTL